MRLAEWFTFVTRPLIEVLSEARGYLPRVVGAVVILLLGWVAAKLVRYAVHRISHRLYGFIPGSLSDESESEFQAVAGRALEVLSSWLVLLLAAAAASEVLGLSAVTGGLTEFAHYLPNVITAVLVGIGGVVVANVGASWVRTTAAASSLAYGESLASATRAVFLVVTIIVALSELGIDSTLLIVGASTVLAAFLGGVALAFGLGARTIVANIVASHYTQRAYRVRQRIRIGQHEGRILEMLPTGVLLDTEEGPAFIPGKEFQEMTSTRLVERETS